MQPDGLSWLLSLGRIVSILTAMIITLSTSTEYLLLSVCGSHKPIIMICFMTYHRMFLAIVARGVQLVEREVITNPDHLC
jgi:hypothetical protein